MTYTFHDPEGITLLLELYATQKLTPPSYEGMLCKVLLPQATQPWLLPPQQRHTKPIAYAMMQAMKTPKGGLEWKFRDLFYEHIRRPNSRKTLHAEKVQS